MSSAPRRALLVIDVQNEYVTGNLPIAWPPVESALDNIAKAMDAAREASIPVIVVQHDAPEASPVFAKGSPAWQLHPVVAGRKADHVLHKALASCYTGTDLADFLAGHGIDTLAVCGFMTHNCDAATIYEARHRGLNVEFLADASGSPAYENAAGKASAEEIHRVYSVVFHSNFASVTSTAAWAEAVRKGEAIARDNVYLSAQRPLKKTAD